MQLTENDFKHLLEINFDRYLSSKDDALLRKAVIMLVEKCLFQKTDALIEMYSQDNEFQEDFHFITRRDQHQGLNGERAFLGRAYYHANIKNSPRFSPMNSAANQALGYEFDTYKYGNFLLMKQEKAMLLLTNLMSKLYSTEDPALKKYYNILHLISFPQGTSGVGIATNLDRKYYYIGHTGGKVYIKEDKIYSLPKDIRVFSEYFAPSDKVAVYDKEVVLKYGGLDTEIIVYANDEHFSQAEKAAQDLSERRVEIITAEYKKGTFDNFLKKEQVELLMNRPIYICFISPDRKQLVIKDRCYPPKIDLDSTQNLKLSNIRQKSSQRIQKQLLPASLGFNIDSTPLSRNTLASSSRYKSSFSIASLTGSSDRQYLEESQGGITSKSTNRNIKKHNTANLPSIGFKK